MVRLRLVVVGVVAGAMLAFVAVSVGDVNGCPSKQDDAITGCPAQPGHSYTGTFQSNPSANYDDLDYLRFTVAKAGQTLHFALANTTNCSKAVDVNQDGCPVYLTLMDSSNHQVGGDNSGAGTVVTKYDTLEGFDWTFAQAGTYYMLLESDGDTAGSPSYSVKYGAPPTPTAPLIKSLKVPSPQHGTSVRGTVTLGQAAVTLRGKLYFLSKGHSPSFITSVKKTSVAAGKHTLVLSLTSHFKQMLNRRHHLSLEFKVQASNRVSGTKTKIAYLTLKS